MAFGQNLADVETAPRITADQIGEGASSIDPEVPAHITAQSLPMILQGNISTSERK